MSYNVKLDIVKGLSLVVWEVEKRSPKRRVTERERESKKHTNEELDLRPLCC